MSMIEDGSTLKELMIRLTELERANARMSEELGALRTERSTSDSQLETPIQVKPSSSSQSSGKLATNRKRRSRRGLLRKGLGVAAATFGAAAALEMSGGTALANGTESSTTFNNGGGSSPAVTANSTSPASSHVNAIKATSTGYSGIAGITTFTGSGVSGVYGQGPSVGVAGQVNGANTQPNVRVAVYGTGSNGSSLNGIGVQGESDTNYGVYGLSPKGYGVVGSGLRGVFGHSVTSYGVLGISDSNIGVWGQGNSSSSTGLVGVGGYIGLNSSVTSSDISAKGVTTNGQSGYGVYSICDGPSGYGVYAEGDSVGVYANSINSTNGTGVVASGITNAGVFNGNVNITGTLTKGGGTFKIDHPLDPANKYLSHSFVESPDMKNVYDGVVTLDAHGEAVVDLPAWFEVLNKDFRYQLTPIGASGPNLYIAAEVSNKSFKIAGGTPAMKVSWQVTGIRQDAWAKANPVVVEQNKSGVERGHYLHPMLHGHPEEKSILIAQYESKRLHR